jgi:HAD superfamily hydrolase (TIGR01490 family)
MDRPHLVLFDLDHTLLAGDSDQLWCDFLVEQALMPPEPLGRRNQAMARGYKDGTVDVRAFCEFYIGTLCLMPVQAWQPWRALFFQQCILPRLAAEGVEQIRAHQEAGHRVLMTTATNRFITELTAAHLGMAELIATEPEVVDGRFTGRLTGEPNMRQGKVARLHHWLEQQGWRLGDIHSTAYSDSINDLPLLEAVERPVCAQPDVALEDIARERGWPVVRWF